jgi:hypothetical protein
MTINSSHATTPYPNTLSHCLQRLREEKDSFYTDEEYSSDFDEEYSSDFEEKRSSNYASEEESSTGEKQILSSSDEAGFSSDEELQRSRENCNERKVAWLKELNSGRMKYQLIERAACIARLALVAFIAHFFKHEEYPFLALSAISYIAFGYVEKKAQQTLYRVYLDNIKPQNFYGPEAEELD